MSVQFHPLLLPFTLNVPIAAGLGYYTYGRLQEGTSDKTLVGFFWLIVFSGVWSLSRALQYLLTSELLTIGLFAGVYVGYGGVTVAFLYFSLAFTDHKQWLGRRTIAAVALVPAVAFVLGTTNSFHSLLWSGQFQYHGDLYVYQREFTPLFLSYVLYTQVLLYYAVYRLVRFALESKELYRWQAVAVVVASAFPIVSGVLYALDATPLLPDFVDLTPVGFTASGLCFAYAIFRYQLLDIVPVARDTVVENMRDGYVVLDTSGKIVDLNDAAASVAEQSEAIGKPAETVFPACADLIENHEHGTRSEAEFSVEVDGEQRFLIATVSSLSDDGRRIGRLLLVRDVTERRSVQKRYQALIENSADLIFVMEPDGTLTYASPSLRTVTGADPELVSGEAALEFIHEDDRERVRAVFESVQNEPNAQQRVEYRIRTDDGEWIDVEAELTNLLEDPYVEGIVSNARDITERKKREQELEELNERLAAANDRLEQFAGVVSHDLRNPINVARGRLDLARETGEEEHFEAVDRSLRRMEEIIDDVLTLAKQGESVGEMERVELGALARGAWQNVETGPAALTVETDAAIRADATRLRQLLENVFRNAVEHGTAERSANGGGSVTVRVGIENGVLYVADDGPGIPPEQREQVFETGYSTAEQGTGLGLSIVAEIAGAHGWEPRVVESADGGARFEFDGVRRLEAPE